MSTPSPELPFAAELPPLRLDEGGAIRIGKSRITLGLLVEEYENGMTAEEMVQAYDTLNLADVHAAIAYYLRHQEVVRGYLVARKLKAIALRQEIECRCPPPSRAELLARRQEAENSSAPPSDG